MKIFISLILLFSAALAESSPASECYMEPARAKCAPDTVIKERFTFDSKSGECKPYNYGCGPTTNIYKTLEECIEMCKNSTDESESDSESIDIDSVDDSSPENDESEEENSGEESDVDVKYNIVVDEAPSICMLKAEPGVCKAYFPRFFFNNETGKCERFIYGGCRGNLNNFLTEAECLEKCGNNSETTEN